MRLTEKEKSNKKNMKRLFVILFAILLLPLTALCQDGTDTQDSTQFVAYPLWVMWRYEHDAKVGEECRKTVILLEEEVNKGLQVEVGLRDQNKALKEENSAMWDANENLVGENRSYKALYENEQDNADHEREQKNKWKLSTVVAVAVIVLQFIFGG